MLYIFKNVSNSKFLNSIKDELSQKIKTNFVEFMKVFNQIYKHVPKKEVEPIKLNTRVVEKPLGTRKLFMLELLTALIKVERSFLLYVSKETWCHLVDNVFEHPENKIYHTAFLKLFLEMFKFRDENLYVTVIISQNIMAKVLDFY